MAGDDEGEGGTEGGHGRRKQGEVDEWMDLKIKAVSLIYHSLPLRNRLNDEWMDGCIEWRNGGHIKASKNRIEGSTDAWKDNDKQENHRS